MSQSKGNGWTKELEILFTEWADRAACFNWMHDKTTRMFHINDQCLMFPVIILSTIGGAANLGINSVIHNETTKNYIQLGLGGLSIFSGILITIANRLAYSAAAEKHMMAAVSWGKFNNLICIELSMEKSERTDIFTFIKLFRLELNRLLELSPTIPESIIRQFGHRFKHVADIKKPIISGDINYTSILKLNLNKTESVLRKITNDDLPLSKRNNKKVADETEDVQLPNSIIDSVSEIVVEE